MMDNHNNKKPIREKVLEAVRSGRVAMRPKWHFVLRAALLAAGAVLAFLTLLYVLSFALFALRRSGVLFVPAFGVRGWYAFLASLPWMLIAVSLVFIFILEMLVRRYAFAYRRPLLYSVLGIVLLAVLGGLVVDRAHFHMNVSRFVEDRKIPFAGDFYRELGSPRFREVHPGQIVGIASTSFVIQNPRDETLTVFISSSTRFPLGMDFAEGDTVVVFGSREDGTVQALGIRRVEDEMMEMHFRTPGPGMMRMRFLPPQF